MTLFVVLAMFAQAAELDCPIEVEDFYSMNVFCGGRGAVAGVGRLTLFGGGPAYLLSAAPADGLVQALEDETLDLEALTAKQTRILTNQLLWEPPPDTPEALVREEFFAQSPVARSSADLSLLERRFGTIVVGERVIGSLGVQVETPAGRPVDVAVGGCALCHTGRVVGRVYPGLGNKTIDVWSINTVLHAQARLQVLWFPPLPFAVEDPDDGGYARDRLIARAYRTTGRMADTDWSGRARGLLSDAYVMWWYRGHARNAMVETQGARGEVKIPSLWHFDTRRGRCGTATDPDGPCEEGLFTDGVAAARELLAGAELGADPSPDVVVSADYQSRVREVEDILMGVSGAPLRPPPYPCPDDVEEARYDEGRALFRQDLAGAKSCATCHGEYGDPLRGASSPSAPPKLVPGHRVGTDEERLYMVAKSGSKGGVDECETGQPCAMNRKAFDDVSAPRSGLARARWKGESPASGRPLIEAGYYAPRLEGIWARFPYLHNGSVPTVGDLLGPERMRPLVFDLAEASTVAGFDRRRLGLQVPDGSRGDESRASWVRGGAFPKLLGRTLYYVARWPAGEMGCPSDSAGCWSNRGHAFWGPEGLPKEQREALITYLSTLGAGVATEAEDWCAD